MSTSLFCCCFSVFHEFFFLKCSLVLLLATTASRAVRKKFRTVRASGMYLTSHFLSLAFLTEENIFYLTHCGPFIVCHCCAVSVMGNISTGASLRRRLIREQLLEIKTPNRINLFGFGYGVTSYLYAFLGYMYVCLQTDLFITNLSHLSFISVRKKHHFFVHIIIYLFLPCIGNWIQGLILSKQGLLSLGYLQLSFCFAFWHGLIKLPR